MEDVAALVDVVLDSSVVINLLATGRAGPILRALSIPIVVIDSVIREQGAVSGRPEVDLLKQMIGDQTVRVWQQGCRAEARGSIRRGKLVRTAERRSCGLQRKRAAIVNHPRFVSRLH